MEVAELEEAERTSRHVLVAWILFCSASRSVDDIMVGEENFRSLDEQSGMWTENSEQRGNTRLRRNRTRKWRVVGESDRFRSEKRTSKKQDCMRL